MLSLLLLEIDPGYPDPVLIDCVLQWLLLEVCWAIGYYLGSRFKLALRGGAIGCSLAVIAAGLRFAPVDFSFSNIFFIPIQILIWCWIILLGFWVWCWSAAGYKIGLRYSRYMQGGWWGGILGPIGVLIFVAITALNAPKTPK
jgi:hypothetical protein